MDSPSPHPSQPLPPGLLSTDEEAWGALRDELAELNVQLEYLRLLLKLGVHRL
ncbi:MAG TPA: hypothetical protein VLI72_13560 [Methylibium sp.]|nr:hypothetical protein [Methylibium sp.]